MLSAHLPALIFVVGGTGCGGAPHGIVTEPPPGPLGLEQARVYLLDLVNRDREEEGLTRIALDDVANRSAQRQVEDMAVHGFTAHWGTDGSVPEQRYTEAGGVHMVQENSFCLIDGVERRLDPRPAFTALELERLEAAFMGQIPPHDSHRRNVLTLMHNGLGVGLAKTLEVDQACVVEVFVDAYGVYDPLPRTATVGQRVTVRGELSEPVEFRGVGIARLDPPEPLPAARLASLDKPEERVYRIPDPYVTYLPATMAARTTQPVKVQGRRFEVEVVLDDRARPGRYEISIWGRHPGSDNPSIVSLRTMDVRVLDDPAR